jgi:hypothetical protein
MKRGKRNGNRISSQSVNNTIRKKREKREGGKRTIRPACLNTQKHSIFY